MDHERSRDRSGEDMPSPAEFVAATERAFGKCPKFSGLRLISAQARFGLLSAQFEGPAGDFHGPYGVIVQLPPTRQHGLWVGYAGLEGSVDDWACSAVAMRALDAHTTLHQENRTYSPDGVWWLINDNPAAEEPGNTDNFSDPTHPSAWDLGTEPTGIPDGK
jgi:hypothetical protein